MTHPTEVFKFTIIESPINRIMDESLFHNVSNQPNGSKRHYFKNINDVRSLQQLNSKSSQLMQNGASKDKSLNEGFQYTIINESLAKNDVSKKKDSVDWQNSKKYVESQGLGNNGKLNIYRKLHFEQQTDPAASNILKPVKNETFNRILEQIGDFKKSINQIRQKLSNNVNKSKLQQQFTSQKKKEKLYRFDYSHENYRYTNYKDLSNRGKSNRSYDRWRSHERSCNFLKQTIPIQQFTIDASDPK